ncbi:MAG TPA: head GIN domain-containing protein [Puia sp.]|nr:head GIN domain-containing protein [Puia sp.]
MKNALLFAAFTVASLSSIAQNEKTIRDNNVQKRAITGFHAIRISNGIDLYLSQGEEAVAVSAASVSDRDRIITEVENGVLQVHLPEEEMHWGSRGDRKLKAYISVKQLDALKASGGSDVYIETALRSDKLDLGLSGGSDLKGKMMVRELTIEQSGGSDIYLGGEVTRLSVHASGGSDFHGYELVAGDCRVEASGGSDIQITANKELSVTASGGSDVYYKGDAQVRDQHASGSSSITHKG